MNLRYFFRVVWASMISHFKLVIRYVSVGGLISFNICGPLFFLLTSWIVQNMMASDFFTSVTGMSDYLAYATIGFAFNSFIFSVAFGGSNAIRGEQEEGTAELVFLTPSNKFAWILGKTVGNLCFSFIP